MVNILNCKSLPFFFCLISKRQIALYSPGWSVGRSVGVTINFFNIYRHTSLLLTQYHFTQAVPIYTDPVPPNTNQYCLILTQYHQVPTSTTLNCSITTKYQSVSPYTDQIPSFINQYRPILTQYQQVPTCITLYNSSSCNAQLSQLDGFSFCDSFDESRSVFGPVFSYFSCSVFFFSKKKYIFLIHFSSAPPKKILPQILSKDQ